MSVLDFSDKPSMTEDFDGRLLSKGFLAPVKCSVELVPSLSTDHHGIQASKTAVDISRGRRQIFDRSRADDARLDETMNADHEKVHGGTSVCRGEAKKECEAAIVTSDMDNVHVRADNRLSRDPAELDSRRIVISKLRDSRNEDAHGLCEEDEPTDESWQASAGKARSRILQDAVSQGVRQAQLLHQKQHPQPQQSPAVRWERFLPQRQLRVLLVEDDDSTRHVVSALLRNCSYEVTFAANGLLAWELLLDQTNRVDLVLTEVVMPCLSGIGLLSRIIGHGAFKHIPVIMMSSHDSMGIVFKCLSKGAVDFLVKPVRKNELKNLWQHVWRRCHSSSGSGSGSSSGSQTQKRASPKVAAADCNISGSNDGSDNTSSGLNAVGGSDNGSGTQSSWTKKAVEVESSQHQVDRNLANPYTKSQQLAPKQAEDQADSVKGFALTVTPHTGKCFDATTGQDSEIASLQLAATDSTYFHKFKEPLKSSCMPPDNVAMTSKVEGGLLENTENGLLQDCSVKAIDLIGAIAGKDKSGKNEEREIRDEGDVLENWDSNSPISKDKTVSEFNSPPLLELSLKRPSQYQGDDRERNVGHRLRHSCSSAFSRYNTSGNHTLSPVGTLAKTTNCNIADYREHANVQRSNVGSSKPSSVSFPRHLERVASSTCEHYNIQRTNVGCSNPSSVPFTAALERVASSTCGINANTAAPIMSNLCNVNSKDSQLPPAYASCNEGLVAGSVKDETIPLHLVSGTGMAMPITLPHGIMCDGLSSGYGPVHHSMFYVGHTNTSHWGSQAPAFVERSDDDDCCASREQSPAPPSQPQISHNPKTHQHSLQHHHIQHHYHHDHHHHHQNLIQHGAMTPQQGDQAMTSIGGEAPICGSSNMLNAAERNTGQSGSTNGYGSNVNGNGSVNGSATGSNNGSNNGQSAAALTAGGNGDSCPQPGSSGTGTGNGMTANNGALSGLDENRFARREAALTKFRLKRKERCFEKKVRYQSRKRLAEQRPRVRGQFVRQSVYESAAGEPG